MKLVRLKILLSVILVRQLSLEKLVILVLIGAMFAIIKILVLLVREKEKEKNVSVLKGRYLKLMKIIMN